MGPSYMARSSVEAAAGAQLLEDLIAVTLARHAERNSATERAADLRGRHHLSLQEDSERIARMPGRPLLEAAAVLRLERQPDRGLPHDARSPAQEGRRAKIERVHVEQRQRRCEPVSARIGEIDGNGV